MRISEKGINLIKKFESFKSKPYLCPAGKPTIGYGNTYYPNRKLVTLADKPITIEEANKLLKDILISFETCVNVYTTADINQNQFDAMVCLCYNIGEKRFKNSTLLKIINANPNDIKIKDKWKEFRLSEGKVLQGLINRRNEEINLYFS